MCKFVCLFWLMACIVLFRIKLAASNSQGFGNNASVTIVTLDFGELI